MSTVRHRLRALLDAAIELDEPARSRFVEAACAADPELARALASEPAPFPDLDSLDLLDEGERPFAGNTRFEVRRKLGSGGFGDVYEAFDRQLGSEVALKVLRRIDTRVVEEFKQGYRALDRLSHPNLCEIYELVADQESGCWLLTMELVHGQHLLEYLGARPSELRPVFCQIAQGLNALHTAGILHCDIKPANVLVTAGGRAVLVDFGLTRTLDSPRANALAITPEFAAPELFAGAPFSRSSDWFAAGAMLARALPENPPPDLEDLGQLAAALTANDPARRPESARVLRLLCQRGPDTPIAPTERFFGRESECNEIRRMFGRVLAGDGAVLHVSGASGIGKSALIRTALSHLVREFPGMVVLPGACYRGESLPFKALDEIVTRMAAILEDLPLSQAQAILPPEIALLARLFPVLSPLVPVGAGAPAAIDALEARRRAFDAFWQLTGNLSRIGPVLMVIDDLQWSDLDSCKLLAGFQTGCGTKPVLLITVRREEDEPPPGFDTLRNGASEMRLGPLPSSEAVRMAEHLLGSSAGHPLAALVAEAGGSPFLLRQLAAHTRKGGAVAGLNQLVERQLNGLSGEERRLVEVLAVAKIPLAQATWRQVADSGTGFAVSRASLMKSMLVRGLQGVNDAVAPYHDRIGEAIAAAISGQRERDIHEKLARALDGSGDPDLERIAMHFFQAGLLNEALARGKLAADRAAGALAFERAASLYQRVIEWSRACSLPVGKLERSRGDALVNCGRAVEAARAFDRAFREAAEPDRMPLRIRIASELLRGGEIEEGLGLMRQILREHELPFPKTKSAMIARYLWERLRVEVRRRLPRRGGGVVSLRAASRMDACWAAAMGVSMVHPVFKEVCSLIYLRLALDSGDKARLAVGWSSLASNLAYVDDGELREARSLLDQSEVLARESGEPYPAAFVEGNRAVVAMLGGHWRKSLGHAIRACAMFQNECQGASWEYSTIATYAFTGRVMTGDWLTNAREMPPLLRQARDRGDRYTEVSLQLIAGYYATYLITDEPDAAEENVTRCISNWPGREFDIQRLYAFQALVDLDLYRGNVEAAWSRAERTWPDLVNSGLLRLTLLDTFAYATRARAAIAMAATAPSRKVRRQLLGIADKASRHLHRSKAKYAEGLALLLDAGCAITGGRPQEARGLLLRAETELETNEVVPWLAVARLALGRLLDNETGQKKYHAGMAWMTSQQIRKPECLKRMLFPCG